MIHAIYSTNQHLHNIRRTAEKLRDNGPPETVDAFQHILDELGRVGVLPPGDARNCLRGATP